MVVLNSGDDTALSEHLGTGVAAGARKAHHEGTQGTPHPISPTQESSVWGQEATKHHLHVLPSKGRVLDRIKSFQIKEIVMAKNWK